MSATTLLEKIAAYVRNLFAIHQQTYLYYHNLSHTENVVKHTAILSAYYQLNERDHFILMAAAWFHDTGHLFGDAEKHEERSAELMLRFLENSLYKNEIATCILATTMPVHPENLLEMMLCDADTWHLGTEEFIQEDERVWLELEARRGQHFEHKTALSLKFMQQHQFYTGYCIEHLSEGKRRNEASLAGNSEFPQNS